ncbi:LacI family DNA-binding transcriptional regulator [Lichenihabitans sp. Uapishka_5]|uniref:LacI family DNA-binding transcriptional regulator n=1 Tax=Lichenihabitans sp. Uapishka_5 TaxID=3037302 RepID=UPI0029E80E43|nr:LacI family DNA-binding transcriptional regulator [Lichenihabitans sp. Uapishka_5]MDX7951567.1 LacI family DNA-binding transcriptional regulator [Lichenihabitans sp. Uapishka_5]
MRQVAERAGVALATVSRAFSAPTKLSPATLRRIEQASEDLDYTVNLNARALRGQGSGVILVLLPDIGNPFFSLLLKGIEEGAREAGQAVLIGDTAGEPALRERSALQVQARAADALILLDGQVPFAAGSRGRARLLRAPVVAVSERVRDEVVPYVGIDNVAAARDVATLLADAGHQHVAHIGGPDGSSLSAERAEGFRAGAAARGLSILGTVVGRFTTESGRKAAEAILSWPQRPTAVFAASDEMAMGFIAAAQARGVSVPDEIAVVGFDDIAFSELFAPALTTVRQPRHAMGRAAADLVVRWRAGSRRSVILPHEVVMRDSFGPPRRR